MVRNHEPWRERPMCTIMLTILFKFKYLCYNKKKKKKRLQRQRSFSVLGFCSQALQLRVGFGYLGLWRFLPCKSSIYVDFGHRNVFGPCTILAQVPKPTLPSPKDTNQSGPPTSTIFPLNTQATSVQCLIWFPYTILCQIPYRTMGINIYIAMWYPHVNRGSPSILERPHDISLFKRKEKKRKLKITPNLTTN